MFFYMRDSNMAFLCKGKGNKPFPLLNEKIDTFSVTSTERSPRCRLSDFFENIELLGTFNNNFIKKI